MEKKWLTLEFLFLFKKSLVFFFIGKSEFKKK